MKQEAEFYFFRGRVAQHAILKSLHIGRGDEVVVQAFTCVAVPAPILMTGAAPVYVDIDANTFNMHPQALSSAITTRTKAIIVQHTFGIPMDMDAAMSIAGRRGIPVIEDCCHTLASCFRGQPVGTLGEAAFFSHRWGKPIVLGSGGRAVVRGNELCSEFVNICAASHPETTIRSLRTMLEYFGHEILLRPSMFWLARDVFRALSKRRLVVPTFDERELHGEMVDAGTSISKVHLSRLQKRLSKVNQDTEFRRRVAREYANVLNSISARTFSVDQRFDPVLLRFPILVMDREAVVHAARKWRIELGDWFNSPIHPLTSRDDLQTLGYRLGSCRTAEQVSKHVITLPIDKRIRPAYLRRSIHFLRELSSIGLLAPPSYLAAHTSP